MAEIMEMLVGQAVKCKSRNDAGVQHASRLRGHGIGSRS
jgi:hypothetical protein